MWPGKSWIKTSSDLNIPSYSAELPYRVSISIHARVRKDLHNWDIYFLVYNYSLTVGKRITFYPIWTTPINLYKCELCYVFTCLLSIKARENKSIPPDLLPSWAQQPQVRTALGPATLQNQAPPDPGPLPPPPAMGKIPSLLPELTGQRFSHSQLS